MNKKELIHKLSSRLSISQKEGTIYLNTLQDIISDELSEGNHLVLQGFGTFTCWSQLPRMGRNPRTGAACPIRARNSVKFKPGKFLLRRLNEEIE